MPARRRMEKDAFTTQTVINYKALSKMEIALMPSSPKRMEILIKVT